MRIKVCCEDILLSKVFLICFRHTFYYIRIGIRLYYRLGAYLFLAGRSLFPQTEHLLNIGYFAHLYLFIAVFGPSCCTHTTHLMSVQGPIPVSVILIHEKSPNQILFVPYGAVPSWRHLRAATMLASFIDGDSLLGS